MPLMPTRCQVCTERDLSSPEAAAVAESRLILIASDERRAVQRSIFFFLPPSSFIPLRFYYSRACYDVRGTRREKDLLFAPHGSRIRHTGLMVNRIIVQFAYNSIRFLLLIKFFAAQNRGAIGRIVMYSLSTLSPYSNC